jgi:hypothetical protein
MAGGNNESSSTSDSSSSDDDDDDDEGNVDDGASSDGRDTVIDLDSQSIMTLIEKDEEDDCPTHRLAEVRKGNATFTWLLMRAFFRPRLRIGAKLHDGRIADEKFDTERQNRQQFITAAKLGSGVCGKMAKETTVCKFCYLGSGGLLHNYKRCRIYS